MRTHLHIEFTTPNCKYDLLRGTPWNYENDRTTDYSNSTVSIDGNTTNKPASVDPTTRVTNIDGKKFGLPLRNKKGQQDFKVYHVSNVLAT